MICSDDVIETDLVALWAFSRAYLAARATWLVDVGTLRTRPSNLPRWGWAGPGGRLETLGGRLGGRLGVMVQGRTGLW